MSNNTASNISLTDLEKKVLSAYFKTEYGEGPGDYTWVFSITDHSGIDVKQVRGVLTSLKKKGLIDICNGGGEEASTALTTLGIETCAKEGIS
jgi:hypothetical protein